MELGKLARSFLIVILATITLGSECQFGFLTTPPIGNNTANLSVPYREQIPGFCGPASILMWRLYDGLSELSLQTIGSFVGCGAGGTPSPQIAAGVRQFTDSGGDAILDYGPSQGTVQFRQGAYYSAEVDSISSGVPFVALIEGGLHAVLAKGGSWTRMGDFFRWNSVRYHDPQDGPDQVMAFDEWIDDTFSGGGHILSSTFVSSAVQLASEHGWRVTYLGEPGGDWPPVL